MIAHSEKRSRLQVEELESRLTPATLTVLPRSTISDGTSNTVSDRAQPGLTTAQVHTNGVVTWSLAGHG